MSETNKAYVYKLLKAKGYNANTIAGIMGNIAVETGGTFDFTQKEKGGTGGYGLFQFDPSGKKPEYDLWREQSGREDGASTQIDFMHDSIYTGITAANGLDLVGQGNRSKLQGMFESGSSDEIATMFQNRWEIPKKGSEHNDRRTSFAIDFDPSELEEEEEEFVDLSKPNEYGGIWDIVSNPFGKTYTTVAGDNPYNVALSNGMTPDDFYSLNPEYADALSKGAMPIGQEYKVGNSWFEKI